MHSRELQLPAKIQSLQSPGAAVPRDGASTAPRLYSPRWRWSKTSSAPPTVLGETPQCHPLDILGVFDPPSAAASIHCALPDAVLGATQRVTQAFGAPPFAVLLAIVALCETRLRAAIGPLSDEPLILVGLFGPGAIAARHAAMAIHPEATQHLIDIYAVRGAPKNADDDPLPRGIWPVFCPAYLPAGPMPTRIQMPLPTARALGCDSNLPLAPIAGSLDRCSERDVLASICADDAEASHFPPDVRHRITALPRLMDRLYAVLTVIAPPEGDPGLIRRFKPGAGASLGDELAETAFELAMIARAHLIAFYARVRPASTGSVHRAAAAMLRHRPRLVSPTTLTSGITGRDLRILEAAGWLDARDEETACGLAHRFAPSDAFLRLNIPGLPKKRPSRGHPVSVLCGNK